MTVGIEDYGMSDPATVTKIRAGKLTLRGPGAWYRTKDGVSLGIYPTPAVDTEIELTYVYSPPTLGLDDDVPSMFPAWSHIALVHHVGAYYYDEIEDNPELAERQNEKYIGKALELERFKISESSGDGVFYAGGR